MSASTKFTLANKESKDQKTLTIGAMDIVLPYFLNDQVNKKTWNMDLWQLAEAYQKGNFESFLYSLAH